MAAAMYGYAQQQVAAQRGWGRGAGMPYMPVPGYGMAPMIPPGMLQMMGAMPAWRGPGGQGMMQMDPRVLAQMAAAQAALAAQAGEQPAEF